MKMYKFDCKECSSEFYSDWDCGDVVTCSCSARWYTDYDTDEDGELCPWASELASLAPEPNNQFNGDVWKLI